MYEPNTKYRDALDKRVCHTNKCEYKSAYVCVRGCNFDSLGILQRFLVFWKRFHLTTLSYSWWFPSLCLVTDISQDEDSRLLFTLVISEQNYHQGIVREVEWLRPCERQYNCSFESRTAVLWRRSLSLPSAWNKSPFPPSEWNINDCIIQFALVSHIKWS